MSEKKEVRKEVPEVPEKNKGVVLTNKSAAIVSTRLGVETIDRIWAHLGQIWVRTVDGVEKSWSPYEAARLAQVCGQMAVSAGWTNLEIKQWLELKDLVCEALREALSQRENPGDETTAAVTKAIHESNMLTVDDDAMKRKLVRLGPKFQILKEDEIRQVIQAFPDKSDSWYEGRLKEIEEGRIDYYRQKALGGAGSSHPDAQKVDF